MSVKPAKDEPEVLSEKPKWVTPEVESIVSADPTRLKDLTEIDLLIVAPEKKKIDAIPGYEMKTRYMVKNRLGNDVYFAEEEGNLLDRQLFGSYRTIDIRIFDKNQDVIYLHRFCRCTRCCFPCCLQKMVVESPLGNVIGYVKQSWTLCHPNFTVTDSTRKTVFTIKSITSQWRLCGRVRYVVKSVTDNTEIGRVGREWMDQVTETHSGTDLTNYYGISLPHNLDVKLKAVLLGAVFLIDIMMN